MKADKIIIRPYVYEKFMHFVDKAPGEVSGLGAVTVIDGVPVVTDVWLVKQKNSSASTELDAEEVARLMFEHRDKDLRWWVHSHANMGVFWSGTDNDTIKEFGEHGWLCATVFNKKREMKSAIYTIAERKLAINNFVPETYGIFADNVGTVIQDSFSLETKAAWDAEYEATCKKESYPTYLGNLKENKTDWVELWNERRASPIYKHFRDDQCCTQWEVYMEKHKDFVAKILASEVEPKKESSKTFGEQIAQDLIEGDYQYDGGADYEDVRAEVDALHAQGLSIKEVETLIEQMYGTYWTWIVRTRFEFHAYNKAVAHASV